MINFRKGFTSALFIFCLAVASSCSNSEYPPVATPQLKPITPAARQDLPEGGPSYGGQGTYAGQDASGGGVAEWSAPEREAALFIRNAPIYFYYDSAALTDSAKAVLDQKAEVIKANPQFRVNIGGHCDERGTEAYNYALGGRRAKAARDYLAQRGVPAAQLDAASYGKANPVAPGQGEAAWSRNRRADFAVDRR
ncbi:MAG: OmpA family protein [Deltaproteobacteria bacterium]|nr:OmpA family protein [Deltaproteobacteria bacterium]